MPGLAGAVKVGLAFARVGQRHRRATGLASTCNSHSAVSPLSGSLLRLPSSVTVAPGLTVWSRPAFAVGGLFGVPLIGVSAVVLGEA